jgi:hypothetical protein
MVLDDPLEGGMAMDLKQCIKLLVLFMALMAHGCMDEIKDPSIDSDEVAPGGEGIFPLTVKEPKSSNEDEIPPNKKCVYFNPLKQFISEKEIKGRFDINYILNNDIAAANCTIDDTIRFDYKTTPDGDGPWEEEKSICADDAKSLSAAWDEMMQKTCRGLLTIEMQRLLDEGIVQLDNEFYSTHQLVKTGVYPRDSKVKGATRDVEGKWRREWHEVRCKMEIIYLKGTIADCPQ